MRFITAAAMVLFVAPLAACGGNGDDKLAERVEDQAENRADALEERADQVRDTGEQRADAIDAADLNAEAMSAEQKNAIVANEAAAVR
ncbi:hypothetical protein [Sphingomonas solaris]|uniref:Secreted protein n=1 Tax=Alterirhizorhabdus solaris TaxID=2529389 RepID=A0A558RDD1_9SPHN|nr:hypothetical protein [Sphingomonas solaris]TVV77340.1 hypothetical protein FOY91_00840 [Sphingomonas solaris]